MSGLFGNANDPRDRRHPMMYQAWTGQDYPRNFNAQLYPRDTVMMDPGWDISALQSSMKMCKNCKTMPRPQGNSKYCSQRCAEKGNRKTFGGVLDYLGDLFLGPVDDPGRKGRSGRGKAGSKQSKQGRESSTGEIPPTSTTSAYLFRQDHWASPDETETAMCKMCPITSAVQTSAAFSASAA